MNTTKKEIENYISVVIDLTLEDLKKENKELKKQLRSGK